MISVTTQRRIWDQVCAFLDWAVYEGHIKSNPFKTVNFEQKATKNPYAVLTDLEVKSLLLRNYGVYSQLFTLCLLTGMRLGEAHGLLRSDLIQKGNLGTFIRLRPNDLRGLKTVAAERVIPLHPIAEDLFRGCPSSDRLFPTIRSNMVTKWFRTVAETHGIYRPGLVFHSTRKWFITQCERQGVPEHFTASLVGHASARSSNGITYAIYSGGISDEQKRQIIDQLRLPS
jgi:integrase